MSPGNLSRPPAEVSGLAVCVSRGPSRLAVRAVTFRPLSFDSTSYNGSATSLAAGGLRPSVSRFRRQVSSAEVALDLTAQTFAAALEGSSRYELRSEPARGWLYGIAWNKLHEAQRRGRVEDKVRRALGMADPADR